MNPRKPEFILTLIGGITGFIAGITAILGASIFKVASSSSELQQSSGLTSSELEVFNNAGSGLMVLAMFALVVAIAMFVFAFQLKKNPKVHGIIVLVLSVIGFFLLQLLWIVPGVLGIIAGIMCLARKPLL